MLKKSLILVSALTLILSLASCVEKEVSDLPDTPPAVQGIQDEKRIKLNLFTPDKIVLTAEKNIVYSDYEGGKERSQKYTLDFYKEVVNFTTAYEGAVFEKKVFEGLREYDSFGLQKAFGEFLYFLAEKDGEKSFIRYSMKEDTVETVFSYDGENALSIAGISEDYVVFREDENANWSKVSLSLLDLKSGEAKRFFTYSRDENDMMYSWNFNEIVIGGDKIYFDNTEGYVDGVADINLYEYDAVTGDVTLIDERRATKPLPYNGISYISYDGEKKEYIINNTDSEEVIYLGKKSVSISSSENMLVLKDDKALSYYDGKDTYPIIESSTHIDSVSVADGYVVWDGWNNDAPLFYDAKRGKIISVDPLNDGKRYVGYVSDDYLIFEAHEFVPDESVGEDAITTDALIYYFVKTDELSENTSFVSTPALRNVSDAEVFLALADTYGDEELKKVIDSCEGRYFSSEEYSVFTKGEFGGCFPDLKNGKIYLCYTDGELYEKISLLNAEKGGKLNGIGYNIIIEKVENSFDDLNSASELLRKSELDGVNGWSIDYKENKLKVRIKKDESENETKEKVKNLLGEGLIYFESVDADDIYVFL